MIVQPAQGLRGRVRVPGDKSVTHRAILVGAVAHGITEIHGPGIGADNLSTLLAVQQLGVEATFDDPHHMTIRGNGPGALRRSTTPIDCGNSGTTARLLAGLLAGAGVAATLVGDASLSRRPMRRVAAPLTDMGYDVTTADDGCLPLVIHGTPPTAIPETGVRAVLATASAQVKSCILLSGLFRDTPTEVIEPAASRDHTERLLRAYGVRVQSSPHYLTRAGDETPPWTRLLPGGTLRGRVVQVPGDLSSAAFVWAAGLLTAGEVTVENVGLNPTRTAFLDIVARMGAQIRIRNRRALSSGEPAGDVTVTLPAAGLQAVTIAGDEIPRAIDELPLLAVIGAASTGRMEIRDAAELRVKESDRLEQTAVLLRAMGVAVEVQDDGLTFDGLGGTGWPGFAVDAAQDHRIAMSGVVAALAASTPSQIHQAGWAAVSWPAFPEVLASLGAVLQEEPTDAVAAEEIAAQGADA